MSHHSYYYDYRTRRCTSHQPPLGRFSMVDISTAVSIVSGPKRSALEPSRRELSEDVSFGIGTLWIVKQSSLAPPPSVICTAVYPMYLRRHCKLLSTIYDRGGNSSCQPLADRIQGARYGKLTKKCENQSSVDKYISRLPNHRRHGQHNATQRNATRRNATQRNARRRQRR